MSVRPTPEHLQALRTIDGWRHGDRGIQVIGDMLHSLEDAGLIVPTDDPDPRWAWTLTPEGHTTLLRAGER